MKNKKAILMFSAAIQIAFAISFLAHRNPELHICAIGPIIASLTFVVLASQEEDWPNSLMGKVERKVYNYNYQIISNVF